MRKPLGTLAALTGAGVALIWLSAPASAQTDVDPDAAPGAASGSEGAESADDESAADEPERRDYPIPGRLAMDDMPEHFSRARVLPRAGWGLAYRYERFSRGGNRSGTRRQSVSQVLDRGFTRVPFRQVAERHEMEVMYAPFDRLTLSAMLPVVRTNTRSRLPDGSSFHTHSSEAGDLELSVRWRFIRKDDESLNLHLALQTPTGSVTKKDRIPDGGRERLPYDQQVGNGTWNLLPGLTYLGEYRGTSWGVQLGAEFYLSDNEEGWNRGKEFFVGGWFSQRWFDLFSNSVRFEWREWWDISGSDGDISEAWPSGDPNKYGGAHLELGTGMEMAIPGLEGQRIGVDVGWPVYQSLDGPQLRGRWKLKVGWEWAF